MNYIVTYILVVVISIMSNAFIALAINNDASARDLQKRTTYAVLAFFFPLVVGVIYLCKRSKMQKVHPKMCNRCCNYVEENAAVCPYCSSSHFSTYHNDKSKKLKKSSIVFLVLAVVLYVVGVVLANFAAVPLANSIVDKGINSVTSGDENPLDELSFYDMKGNAYKNMEDVIYYAKDGSQYVNVRDEKTYESFFVNTKDETQKYESLKCFVDKDGYFIYDADGAIDLDDTYMTAKDSEGNVYYPAEIVGWDSSGTLLY